MKKNYIDELINKYPALSVNRKEIQNSIRILITSYEQGNKLLLAGNGGSAADAEHIVGELMKSFVLKRPLESNISEAILSVDSELGTEMVKKLQMPLSAIALTGQFALTTAFSNDVESELSFAQQVLGYGLENDVFFGISTSGSAKNVYAAAVVAKAQGMKVIILTGSKTSKLSRLADVSIHAPSVETYEVQEYHLPIYHSICLSLEQHFFS